MNFELTGKITSVLPTQSGQGKNGEWQKNAFVVEWTDNGYTQKLCLEVVGADKFEKMKSDVAVGNDVVVKFNVTSREYQGRWFTSATCFYCKSVGGQQQNANTTQPTTQAPSPQPQQDSGSGLPF